MAHIVRRSMDNWLRQDFTCEHISDADMNSTEGFWLATPLSPAPSWPRRGGTKTLSIRWPLARPTTLPRHSISQTNETMYGFPEQLPAHNKHEKTTWEEKCGPGMTCISSLFSWTMSIRTSLLLLELRTNFHAGLRCDVRLGGRSDVPFGLNVSEK